MRDDNFNEKVDSREAQTESRNQLNLAQRNEFINKFKNFLQVEECASLSHPVVAENLRFWIEHLSWTYCENCKHLKTERLLPNYFKRPRLKYSKTCTCTKKVYIMPTADNFPNVLKGLSISEVIVLRPFNIHLGDYVKKVNGYRQKTNLFRLTWTAQTVLEKIHALTEPQSKNRCLAAYDFLMTHQQSTYAKFVNLREEAMIESKRFNVYDFSKNVGIECALWPNLYPNILHCETSLSGQDNRASSKIAFMTKVFSQISDYGTNFELLQFHYDLWLFKTVSGAITTARKKLCSAATSLQNKTFSSEFWKWQHRSLVDSVRQFGFPTLFITISPSEWSFPLPPWLRQMQELSGLGETNLAAFETLHFVNTLEQIVRGYLCGSNDSKWKSHLFANTRKCAANNVLNYFYRFEFQNRGTVHMHMLVWLKKAECIDLTSITAHIPWVDIDSAYLVYSLQKSDKDSLPIYNDKTNVVTQDSGTKINICHPKEAFEHNIRAYISTILPALQCRMDVQSSDGHGLLLKYVSSYVTKAHDAYQSECLYSPHTSPYQAAFRHLKEMAPLEPEMWLSLSSKKIAWTPHRQKKFTVPIPATASNNKILQAYWSRPRRLGNVSLLDWLRQFDTSKEQPIRYKKGETLVAVKLLSVFSDLYFFQDMLLNIPHRNTDVFLTSDHENIPAVIRYFVCALHSRSILWNDETAIKSHFELEGHKAWYVTNILFHIQSLKDFYTLWQKRVISLFQLSTPPIAHYPLDVKQQLVFTIVQNMINGRKEYYDSINCILEDSDSEFEEDVYSEEQDCTNTSPSPVGNLTVASENPEHSFDWRKFLMVVGKAGTGKSYALTNLIHTCVTAKRNVMVATPTGYLATEYKDKFSDDIDAETIHAAFHYPVSPEERPTFNWNLSNYDMLIIEELSMVPVPIFDHIFSTISELPIRPVVVMAGDDRQIQPIESIDGRIQTTKSVMTSDKLADITMKVVLTEQHRTQDDKYSNFLDHIRLWQPSQKLLNQIQKGRILCDHDPSDDELFDVLNRFPQSTVICVSHHAANRINAAFLNRILDKRLLLGHVTSDCQLGTIPLYKNMRVMITQNRNKALSIVNGRIATVEQLQGKTVFLRLRNGQIVHVYPVTFPDENGTLKTAVPFMPAYALTIPKAQGQTLGNCIVWLDSPILAPGAGYVALSRNRTLDNIHFMVGILSSQIIPVRI